MTFDKCINIYILDIRVVIYDFKLAEEQSHTNLQQITFQTYKSLFQGDLCVIQKALSAFICQKVDNVYYRNKLLALETP